MALKVKATKVLGQSNKLSVNKETQKVMTIATMKRIARKYKGGGIDCNKGYFPTPADLTAALPIGQPCRQAVVGTTDTIWIWSIGAGAWINTGTSTTTYLGLSDTTDIDYTGKAGYVPIVNPAETALTLGLPLTSSNLQEVTDNGNVTTNDIEVTTIGNGIIIKSPDGTRWKLGVDDTGNTIWTSL